MDLKRHARQGATRMYIEMISEDETLLIRRMILAPGEASDWHKDNSKRFTVIVSGDRLGIEYRDTAEVVEFDVGPGVGGLGYA